MIMESIQAIATTVRELVKNWRSMLVLAMIYALLLLTLYTLINIREASVFQVILTFTLAVTAPVLFFIMQAVSATYRFELKTKSLLKRSLKDAGKLLVVSLPVILLTILTLYLLGKVQTRFGVAVADPAEILEQAQTQTDTQQMVWSTVLVTSVRYLLVGLVLPLTLIHLWLAVAHEGLTMTVKRATHYLARAFTPESVLIYMAGFVVFALFPYLLIFQTIRVNSAWIEIGLLIGKLAVVFALSLFGWVVTMGALQQTRGEKWQATGSEKS